MPLVQVHQANEETVPKVRLLHCNRIGIASGNLNVNNLSLACCDLGWMSRAYHYMQRLKLAVISTAHSGQSLYLCFRDIVTTQNFAEMNSDRVGQSKASGARQYLRTPLALLRLQLVQTSCYWSSSLRFDEEAVRTHYNSDLKTEIPGLTDSLLFRVMMLPR